MIKFFVTGDNHIGRKYDRYPDVKDQLIKSRFECIEEMVNIAESEACDFFVVTGDLFDSTNTIRFEDVKRVVEILSHFNERVLVLPGNHDYYSGEDKVWNYFEKALDNCSHNITLLNEYREFFFDDVKGEEVVIYPAFCDSKHSEENKLGWIKNADMKRDVINIGIAHGAIKGVTPDLKEEYFLMTEKELENIPVDVWFIGHTHIPYPNNLSETKYTEGYKVFNAGTHEQTDLHNNTEGICFIVGVEKKNEKTKVYAKRVNSGKVHFYDLKIDVKPESESALYNVLEKEVEKIPDHSVIRVTITGTIKQVEYDNKSKVYENVLERFLTFEINDDDLSEEITVDKIRSEFAETSFAAQLMEALISDHTELQMVYRLIQECRE